MTYDVASIPVHVVKEMALLRLLCFFSLLFGVAIYIQGHFNGRFQRGSFHWLVTWFWLCLSVDLTLLQLESSTCQE